MDLTRADVERIDTPDTAAPASLDSLLDDLEAEGDCHPPETVDAILAKGNEAIEPLREIVRRGCSDPDDAGSADVATGILGDLRARSAVPDLLQFLREADVDALEFVADALVLIREVPLDELEAIIRDSNLDSTRRDMAIHAYEGIARARPDAQPALVSVLTDVLSEITNRAKSLSTNDADVVGAAIRALASFPSTESRCAVESAFKAGVVQPWAVSAESVDELFEHARVRLEHPTRSFREEYYQRYTVGVPDHECDDDDDEEWESEDSNEHVCDHEDVRDDDEGDAGDYRGLPAAPVVVTKVGRNDPCPCGSGKKYKKCCLNRPTSALAASPAPPASSTPVEKPFTVAKLKEGLARELAKRAALPEASADDPDMSRDEEDSEPGTHAAQHADVPTHDYFEGHRLDDPGDLEGLIESFVTDIEEGYFHTWHAVICQERGLKLTKDQKRRLAGLIDFNDEPSERVLYINEIPRPRQAWHEIVREIAHHLLVEPLDPNGDVYRTTTEAWPDIVNALEEHGRGLPLPEGVQRPADVVPADLQHKLWLQWCIDPLIGVSQEGGPTLADKTEHCRIEDLIANLRECKECVTALNLTGDALLAGLVMPERERELTGKLLMEALQVNSMSEPLAAHL